MAKIYGELEKAQLELTTSDAAAGKTGLITYNKTDEQVKLDDGTNVKALLANDLKAIIGNDGTAANNVRLHRGDDNHLQILKASDTTAEGTTSTDLSQVSTLLPQYTTALTPAASAAVKGHMIWNTTIGAAQICNGSTWVSVGEAGGGSQISSITCGEFINTNSAVYLHEREYITIDATNNLIDFQEGGGALLATVASAEYLLDTPEHIAILTTAIKTALDTAGGLTYTVSYSQSTNKFTIAGSSNFSLLFATGANIATDIAETIGFTAADKTTATSHEADYAMTDSANVPALVTKFYWFGCDADFENKSKGFWGVTTDGGTYQAAIDVTTNTIHQSFVNSDLADLKTLSASITVDATNNKLDFKEGAGELTATIASGKYLAPYSALVAAIATAMDAAGANTYVTTSYDPDSDKVTIAADGSFTLSTNTGTNTATSIYEDLGFDESADTASATSAEADNTLNLKGQVGFASNANIVPNSVTIGMAIDATTTYVARSTDEVYVNTNGYAQEYVSDPAAFEKDYGDDLMNGPISVNASGQAISINLEFTGDATAIYRFRYKTSIEAAWQESTTTVVGTSSGSSSWVAEDWNTGFTYYAPKIFIDDDGKAAACFMRYSSTYGKFLPWVYYTNDLDTWTVGTASGLEGSLTATDAAYTIGDIYIRENKCVILTSRTTDANSEIHISDNSGSGYVSWASTALTPTSGYKSGNPSFCRIQYFPDEAGVNQYRIVTAGRATTNRTAVVTTKGDGTSELKYTDSFIGSGSDNPLAMGMDRLGTGNRIVLFGVDSTFANIYQLDTNETYNSGVITFDNHSSQELNPSANNLDYYNGHTSHSADGRSLWWNEDNRCVTLGSTSYMLAAYNDGQEAWLLYTTDFDAGTWTGLQVFAGGASDRGFEWCLDHIAASNQLVMTYKACDTTANQLTKGQILYAFAELSSTGVPTVKGSFAQLDGGEVLAGWQGLHTTKASRDGIITVWEQDNGTNDSIWSNYAK